MQSKWAIAGAVSGQGCAGMMPLKGFPACMRFDGEGAILVAALRPEGYIRDVDVGGRSTSALSQHVQLDKNLICEAYGGLVENMKFARLGVESL